MNTFKAKRIQKKLVRVISKKTLFLERGILSFFRNIYLVKELFIRVMDMLVVHSVENKDRPKFKVVSIKPSDGNPNFDLSITPKNIVYLEDVEKILNYKFDSIGSEYMNKNMEIVFNCDMIVKDGFEHLSELDLFKYHF